MEVNISVLFSSDQVLFVEVLTNRNLKFVVGFVYGSNDAAIRQQLWADVQRFTSSIRLPFMLLGDLNSIMFPHEKVCGTVSPQNYLDFWNCTQDYQVFDLAYSGCFYTWANGHTDDTRILSRLDRVLVNLDWVKSFSDSLFVFLEAGVSDHSSMIVSIYENRHHGPPPFKFFNFMIEEADFLEMVRSVWDVPVRGNPMFVFVTKLKKVKSRIILWKKERFKNILTQVECAKLELKAIQHHIQKDTLCVESAQKEKVAIKHYAKVTRYEESVAKQKSRVK